MIQNYLPLIYGLVDAFLFLECSGEDEVNPDSAVRCMENMSSSLLTLGHSDQIALRSHLEKIADDAQERSYSEFVRALPDMIGLASL
jgi:hypothetical protein